jgi:hypothetical protein
VVATAVLVVMSGRATVVGAEAGLHAQRPSPKRTTKGSGEVRVRKRATLSHHLTTGNSQPTGVGMPLISLAPPPPHG